MVRGKTRRTAGAAAGVAIEQTDALLSLLPAGGLFSLEASRLSHQESGPEPSLHPLFVPVPSQLECVCLPEAPVQLLPSHPSSELFNNIVKQVSLLSVLCLQPGSTSKQMCHSLHSSHTNLTTGGSCLPQIFVLLDDTTSHKFGF